MSRGTYDRHFDDDGIDTLGMYLVDGVDADAFAERVLALSEGRQQLRASSNAKRTMRSPSAPSCCGTVSRSGCAAACASKA